MPCWAAGVCPIRHQPLPQAAVVQHRAQGTPRVLRKSAILAARFRCFKRTQRSLRRIHWSMSARAPRTFAWRKYVTQPVRNELSSPIIDARLTPRLRRVICRIRSLARSSPFRRLLAETNSALRSPVSRWAPPRSDGPRCSRATTASADFSPSLPRRCRRGSRIARQTVRPPGLSLESFPRASPDLPAVLPDEHRASASIAALPSTIGLVSDFYSSSPSFGIGSLQIPPRDGHPGLASRFRPSRPAENSHLQDPKHAQQTKPTARLREPWVLLATSINA